MKYRPATIPPAPRPLSDIPNSAGFRLLAIDTEGKTHPAKVTKDATGCHILTDDAGAHMQLARFTGWTPAPLTACK